MTYYADPAQAHALLPALDTRLVLYRIFLELNNRTRKLAQHDPVCQRLMSTPGVGFVTALYALYRRQRHDDPQF